MVVGRGGESSGMVGSGELPLSSQPRRTRGAEGPSTDGHGQARAQLTAAEAEARGHEDARVQGKGGGDGGSTVRLTFSKPSALAEAAAFLAAAARRSISPDAVSFMRCSSTVESTLWSSVLPTSPWMLFICDEERTATSRMLPEALLANRDSSACASADQS